MKECQIGVSQPLVDHSYLAEDLVLTTGHPQLVGFNRLVSLGWVDYSRDLVSFGQSPVSVSGPARFTDEGDHYGVVGVVASGSSRSPDTVASNSAASSVT